MLAIIA